MSKLNQELIERETDKIMAHIEHLDEKKSFNYRKIWYPTFSLVITFIFIFSFSILMKGPNQTTTDGPINNRQLSLMKVGAEEYKLFTENSLLYINVLTLVENQQLTKFNEDISYYTNFNKYINVSDKTNLEIVKVKNTEFLKIIIDERIVKYYYIHHAEKTLLLFELHYSFTDFNQQMELILNLMEEYPPVITKEKHNDLYDWVYDHYQEHPDAKLMDDESYLLYAWYVRELDQISRQTYQTTVYTSFQLVFYMTGDETNIGEIKNKLQRFNFKDFSEETIQYFEFPVKINNCTIHNSSITSGEIQLYYSYTTGECTNEFFKQSVILSMIIDMSQFTEGIKLEDYNIVIHYTNQYTAQSREIVVTQENSIINGNELYVMPIAMKYEGDDLRYSIITDVDISDASGNQLYQWNRFHSYN